MDNQETHKDNTSFFYERFSGQTDDEILKILRNHRNYQEAAVAAAVKVAVERELIHSEQDLLSPEFQQFTPHHFSLFPPITNAYHLKKLIGSIFRFIYLLSLVPIIYGIMSYAEGKLDRMLEGVVVGIFWAVLSFLFRKSGHVFLMGIMLLILASVLVMSSVRILDQAQLNILDLLMAVTGTVLPAYLLLYVKRLLQASREKE